MIGLPIIEAAVTCDGCGVCCMHMSTPPYEDDEREMLRAWQPHVYADMLAVERTRELQLRVVGTDYIPCGFFDCVTRRCKHHQYKPDICARFEVGGEFCRQVRKDAGFERSD
jgi:Fe-S-cluster containining protein